MISVFLHVLISTNSSLLFCNKHKDHDVNKIKLVFTFCYRIYWYHSTASSWRCINHKIWVWRVFYMVFCVINDGIGIFYRKSVVIIQISSAWNRICIWLSPSYPLYPLNRTQISTSSKLVIGAWWSLHFDLSKLSMFSKATGTLETH